MKNFKEFLKFQLDLMEKLQFGGSKLAVLWILQLLSHSEYVAQTWQAEFDF